MRTEIGTDFETIVARLGQRLPGLRAVYVFGSFVDGPVRPDSDLDLAVLCDHPVDSVLRFELSAELAGLAHRDVDLIDLYAAPVVLRMQVIGKGLRLAGSGPELEDFEDRVFSDYARLNEERAALLQDIRERGSVYGR